MITRSGVIQYTDMLYHDYEQFCNDALPLRLPDDDVRELQDQHNVNLTGDDDDWLDADPLNDGTVTIIEELEFWERFGDVETV